MSRYPDNTLENALRDAGASVQCLWQSKGPDGTQIAWQEGLSVNGRVVIVQTFDSGGWDAFSSYPANDIAGTVADVLERCSV